VFDSFEVSGFDWMESAILFESGAYKLVDKVVAVVAPLEVRIQRVMQRDNISREKALDWMNRQMNQDEVARKADFVVINDGETDLENQIIKIIEQCNKQF
jgi:dephospho-CoA kinase